LKWKKQLEKTSVTCCRMASLALVISSCQKEKNAPFQTPNDAVSRNAHATTPPELCSAIPDSLQVPDGNRFFLRTFARGVQIYQVQRSAADPNRLVWVNIAPLATLYTKPDFVDPIIHHYAGPTWQFLKGPFKDEKVVARN
jgi:hypothetical protein